MHTDAPTLAEVIDLRQFAPEHMLARIASSFQSLPVGGFIDLQGEAEPATLREQLGQQWPKQFDWESLPPGAAPWRVRLARRPAGKSCCGCCGG
ncbi:DUF2249 domain-containing protein [Paucibacter sp. APW11]|uniref:DUF2249 domain-containing protein n=1 Tax=Roseateles aquae TaxID=3077235 RepID=A0ABU3P633_9BURK|nr:DUF2249 domain-containing protein [Paucibacter sp. APW11]MDT8998034.1 DUF2249 domain-containing protein [Paucibacter sp. APW11]